MKKHFDKASHIPTSMYYVLGAAMIANIVVTFIMIEYFL